MSLPRKLRASGMLLAHPPQPVPAILNPHNDERLGFAVPVTHLLLESLADETDHVPEIPLIA